VPCFVSGEICYEAHKEDLKSNISRHISATQKPPENARATNETAPLPADLAGLVA